MILTESDVRSYPSSIPIVDRLNLERRLQNKSYGVKVVFLSHSHDDKDLVEPVRLLLANQGVVLYVDWRDPTMPRMTSPHTARLLKERMNSADKFVMLGTNNSARSRWVPWELGVADQMKGLPRIAVFPIQPNQGSWEGHEYVGIYPRIERVTSGFVVVEPGQSSSAVSLRDWLLR